MFGSKGVTDPLPRRGFLEKLLLTLLWLGISFATAWWWSLNGALGRLTSSGQALQPYLTALYPENLSTPNPSAFPGVRISLYTDSGLLVLAEGPYGNTGEIRPPRASSAGQAFRYGEHLYFTFPVQERGEAPAIAILSIPVKALWPKVLGKTLGLLFLISLYRVYRHRRQRTAARPREQLLEEVKLLRTDSIDRKVRLPLDNPFKPVADTMNQLLAARERKDRQLNEQHHQQQILLNNMSEGILTLDNDQCITGLNPAAAKWLNLGNAQRAQGEMFHTVCRNPILLSLIESIPSTGLREEFLRLERPGMEDRIVKVKGSPLIDQDQTMGVLLVLQDVTTLRRLETLRQDFVSNVTHELRTPLTAIKGYTELMIDEPDIPEASRSHLDRMLKQSTRMINIIEDLLSLTRIEDPEDTPALYPTEIQPILQSVVQLCDEQIQLRDLTVEASCPDDLMADLHPPLFEQAIHNLVYNAVKYTYAGTTIRIQVQQQDGVIRIEVQDQGPGIPELDQARIFERFYRVDKARSRAVGGTGLGLSIVKHIVLMHQGEVGVNSILGEGTTFWIEIPPAEV